MTYNLLPSNVLMHWVIIDCIGKEENIKIYPIKSKLWQPLLKTGQSDLQQG